MTDKSQEDPVVYCDDYEAITKAAKPATAQAKVVTSQPEDQEIKTSDVAENKSPKAETK